MVYAYGCGLADERLAITCRLLWSRLSIVPSCCADSLLMRSTRRFRGLHVRANDSVSVPSLKTVCFRAG